MNRPYGILLVNSSINWNLLIFLPVRTWGDAGDGFELADKMVLIFIAQLFRNGNECSIPIYQKHGFGLLHFGGDQVFHRRYAEHGLIHRVETGWA